MDARDADNFIASVSPEAMPYVVNYDHYAPYGRQIEEAQQFYATHRHVRSDFLLKPEIRGRFHNPDALIPHCPDLRNFDLIGLTEKELGDTFLARLESLARIRIALDERNVQAPIHVFGSLDPVFTPMYFVAGAEVFDGLTWLRYAYHEDISTYREVPPALEQNLELRESQRTSRVVLANLDYLTRLRMTMRRFAGNRDFSEFGRHASVLQKVSSSLDAALGGGG